MKNPKPKNAAFLGLGFLLKLNLYPPISPFIL